MTTDAQRAAYVLRQIADRLENGASPTCPRVWASLCSVMSWMEVLRSDGAQDTHTGPLIPSLSAETRSIP